VSGMKNGKESRSPIPKGDGAAALDFHDKPKPAETRFFYFPNHGPMALGNSTIKGLIFGRVLVLANNRRQGKPWKRPI